LRQCYEIIVGLKRVSNQKKKKGEMVNAFNRKDAKKSVMGRILFRGSTARATSIPKDNKTNQ